MHARVTMVQFDPAKLPELEARTGQMKATVKEMKGVVDIYSVWRDDGMGVVTAIFDNKASADAAAAQAQGVWASLAGLMKSPPKVEAFDHVEHLSD